MPTNGTTKRLTYNVFVRKTGDRYTATVVDFPNCIVEAASRREAIDRARAVAEFVSEGRARKDRSRNFVTCPFSA